MPIVSVIIPTFNRAALLRRAISSVFLQTWQDLELIVVDDASTDDTAQLLQDCRDSRLVMLRHAGNRGAPSARNTGLDKANGRYVAFLDSDDEWLPEKLSRQIQLIEVCGESVGLVYTRFLKIGWPRQPEFKAIRGDASNEILLRNFVGTTSTPLIRRSCLERSGGFDLSLQSCQDWDLWIRLARICHFDCLPEVLVHYHHQAQSISMNRAAAAAGHRRIEAKYASTIRSLSSAERGRHHINMAENYYWARAFGPSLAQLGLALRHDPRLIRRVIDLHLLRRLRKRLPMARSKG